MRDDNLKEITLGYLKDLTMLKELSYKNNVQPSSLLNDKKNDI